MEQKNIQLNKQQHKQGYYLSQQHLKLMHLMHLNGMALKEYISNEIELNPALESAAEEIPDEQMDDDSDDKLNDEELWNVDNEWLDKKTTASQSGVDFYEAPVINYDSFQTRLKEQVRLMDLKNDILSLSYYIIDELEDDGFLRRKLSDVTDDFSFSQGKMFSEEDMMNALLAVQKCEPPGVGAQSISECLLIQLKRKKRKINAVVYDVAEKLLSQYFSEFSEKKFSYIKSTLSIDDSQLFAAIEVIKKLAPHPVMETNKYELYKDRIIPDFELILEDDQANIYLGSTESGRLKVNPEFSTYNGINSNSGTKKASVFCKGLVEDAQALIDALKDREVSMLRVMNVIAKRQKAFFNSGDKSKLTPMIQQDIVDDTGLDISTVSRIVSNKYIQTPYGMFCLKDLFVRGIPNKKEEHEDTTVLNIREIIADLISNENKNKPLSDNEIVKILTGKGITIARRTVVKYRDILGLPNSNQRKNK